MQIDGQEWKNDGPRQRVEGKCDGQYIQPFPRRLIVYGWYVGLHDRIPSHLEKIVREFYKLEFGIELKSYYADAPNDIHKANKLIYTNKGDFNVVEGPLQFGDIVLIYLFGVECHIAVYLGDNKILHTQKTSGCMVDRLSRWEKRISCICRLKD